MLATLGDLVEDIVVHVLSTLNYASDTDARIQRRRGGSAATVAFTAALAGHPTRFLGRVGDDDAGRALIAEMRSAGVDTGSVQLGGTTGTIIVLVDPSGERSMLTDRRACADLAAPQRMWLDGVTTLHVPLYSLVGGKLADTAATLIEWAHELGVAVAVDLSSAALIEQVGRESVLGLLEQVRPHVILANEHEVRCLGQPDLLASPVTVIKRGAQPATVSQEGQAPVEVSVTAIGDPTDTTGAGDAFAAGFLTYSSDSAESWRHDPVAACRAGHDAAANLLTSR